MFSFFSFHFSVQDATEAQNENLKLKTENSAAPAAAWVMRPKREHCINTTYHCHPDICPHLRDLEARWSRSGLSRFYLIENHPRDLDTLRAAGRDARICPYEITRAALAFNDIWIGDYNYIFAPANRGIFPGQPGYDPARTLLVIDEAHNLPSRVADIHTHTFNADTADAVSMWFHRVRAPNALTGAWAQWTHFLSKLKPTSAHPLATEDDARELIETLNKHIINTPLDTGQMPPEVSETLWSIPEFASELSAFPDLPRLWWSPKAAQITVTCLDAAQAIGAGLREFAGVVLASATLAPVENFSEACGLDHAERAMGTSLLECGGRAKRAACSGDTALSDAQISIAFESGVAASLCRRTPKPEKLGTLTKRDTKKLFARLTTAADLLAHDEARNAAAPALVRARTPWRDDAYDVAIDARVSTTFQQRGLHAETTANTIAALAASSSGNIAVFFPSYAYAETIKTIIEAELPDGGIFLQPRLPDLAAQNAWVEQSLAHPGALFLVLGSSFAEGIDLLGGRISHAMVVGPALPEVNAVQRARLTAYAFLGRDAAARRVYQIPGIQKVNQALGRLVRAPGHRAKILLHCRRFAEESYHELLAPEYRSTRVIESDAELAAWLG
jgi:Rad3-related DNA helicase